MQLSGPQSRMGVRFELQLALWPWVQSSKPCCGFRPTGLSFVKSANSGRASRLTSSSGTSERPWLDTWWSFLPGFLHRLTVLPDDSLHLDILQDNIADAKGPLPCADSARGIEVKLLLWAFPFFSSGISALDSHGFMDRLAGARQRTWDGLHVSPRAAPSHGAKLCTYYHFLID